MTPEEKRFMLGLLFILIDFALIVSGITCIIINHFVDQNTALSNFLCDFGWCGIGVSIGTVVFGFGWTLIISATKD